MKACGIFTVLMVVIVVVTLCNTEEDFENLQENGQHKTGKFYQNNFYKILFHYSGKHISGKYKNI